MIFSSRSTKRGLKSFKKLLLLLFIDILISFIIDLATSDYKEQMSYSVGCPVNKQIFSIWSRVEFPGNKGFCART